jgi:hypothetical protein
MIQGGALGILGAASGLGGSALSLQGILILAAVALLVTVGWDMAWSALVVIARAEIPERWDERARAFLALGAAAALVGAGLLGADTLLVTFLFLAAGLLIRRGMDALRLGAGWLAGYVTAGGPHIVGAFAVGAGFAAGWALSARVDSEDRRRNVRWALFAGLVGAAALLLTMA